MNLSLPRLPYAYDVLEPHISRSTLEVHHGRHHRAYGEKTVALAKQPRLADAPRERIIGQTAGQESHRALFRMRCHRSTAWM
jgi:Fe-Mn family superoxide dismutase